MLKAHFVYHALRGDFLTVKTWMVMKLLSFFMFAACMQVSAKGFTQTLTLKEHDVSLPEIFRKIEKQTGYTFIYNRQDLAVAKKVTINVMNKSLEEVLTMIFKDQPLSYKVFDKIIAVQSKQTAIIQPADNSLSLPPPINVHGRIVNEKGEPVIASVQVKGTSKGTTTNDNGEFELKNVDDHTTLIISGVSIETFEVNVNGRSELALNAKIKTIVGENVNVEVNTGYQRIPKERATGAFEFINNEELNRKVGPDILSRLEGVTTGIFFDRRGLEANQTQITKDNIQIRGLSTLTGTMAAPLIVLNNFPYEGDINNINPYDIENITVLKDAAAASIWGAKAANGVIVITTKEGHFNKPPEVSLSANLNIIQKPDLFTYKRMTASEYIDVETSLFNNGFFDGDLGNTYNYPALSPIVEILNNRRNNLISSSDSASQIDALRNKDVRNDFAKYFYRTAYNQQYNLNISGGGQFIKYLVSGGFDNNPNVLVGVNDKRATLFSNISIELSKKLDVTIGLNYNNSFSTYNTLGNIGSNNYNYYFNSRTLYPYAQLADVNGNALAIAKDYRPGFIDTAGNGMLLNWQYKPLDELRNMDNRTKQQEIITNVGLSYKISRSLQLQGNYQYTSTNGIINNYYNPDSYYARNLINLYSQYNGSGISYIIPNSGILDQFSSDIKSNIGRAQLNYNQSFFGKHEIVALLGGEITERILNSSANRTYGFNKSNYSTAQVDYFNTYTFYDYLGQDKVPYINELDKNTDHYISAYANVAYTYDKRYTVSGSARRDASNLFGLNLKDKWKPFWTIGFAWQISNEKFYHSSFLSNLKLRGSYGLQGNVNNSVAPYTIINYSPFPSDINNLPQAFIHVPANPGLSWETLKQFNLGVDFATLSNRLNGSFDYYHKKSDNLLFGASIDPTAGLTTVTKNSAALSGKGIEVALNSININGAAFKWSSQLGFSYVTNKIIDYKLNTNGFKAGNLVSHSGLSINPVIGSSPYGIFSLPFAGLDTQGNPLGYNGKAVSTDYYTILNQKADTANVIYNGSSIPTKFGFLTNTFSYKRASLQVNLTYSFGFYFRKTAISYYNLFYYGIGNADYAKRWQKPGDEKMTTVPSLLYPLNDTYRDDFYAYSSVNVLKGDNIRLQYIRINYDFSSTLIRKIKVQSLRLFGSVNNLGIIWRANNEGLDPDVNSGNSPYPVPKTFAAGLNVVF